MRTIPSSVDPRRCLGLFLVAGLASGCSGLPVSSLGSSPVVTPTAAPSVTRDVAATASVVPSPSIAATPSPAAALPPGASTLAPSTPAVGPIGIGGAAINALRAGRLGFVAVGFAVQTEDVLVAAAFHSADGRAWQGVALPTSEPHERADALIVNGIALAVGCAYCSVEGDSPPDPRGQVWTSTDGLEWLRQAELEEGSSLDRVTTGGPGYVAFGSYGYSWQTYTKDGLASWTSRDGRAWSGPHVVQECDDCAIGQVFDVGGSLVAIGHVSQANMSTPAAWISADGETWQALDPPRGMADIASVAAGVPGFVGVGYHCRHNRASGECVPHGVTATSTDGLNWRRRADDPVFAHSSVQDVAFFGDRFIAVGKTRSGEEMVLATWTSVDGVRWSAPEVLAGALVPAGHIHMAALDGTMVIAPNGDQGPTFLTVALDR